MTVIHRHERCEVTQAICEYDFFCGIRANVITSEQNRDSVPLLESRRNEPDGKHQNRSQDSDYRNGIEKKGVPFGVSFGPPNKLLHVRFVMDGRHSFVADVGTNSLSLNASESLDRVWIVLDEIDQ